MIRLTYLLRRKPGMSLEDFQAHWRTIHGPLVAGHAQQLDCLRHVQVHTVEDEQRETMSRARGQMEPPYDGVIEMWWENVETLERALATDSGKQAAAELLEVELQLSEDPHPCGDGHAQLTLQLPQRRQEGPDRLRAHAGASLGGGRSCMSPETISWTRLVSPVRCLRPVPVREYTFFRRPPSRDQVPRMSPSLSSRWRMGYSVPCLKQNSPLLSASTSSAIW